MMLSSYLMVFTAILMCAQALPVNWTSPHSGGPVNRANRAYPNIDMGHFTLAQALQIRKAHHDAMQLASTVVSNEDRFNAVGPKYFNPPDLPIVLNLFKTLIGQDDGEGSDILSGLEFVGDWPNEDDFDELSCEETWDDDDTDAEIRFDNPDGVKIVVCPVAFQMGAISDDYPEALGATCDKLDPRVSIKMLTFGHILLHEYFHFPAFTSPIVCPPPPDGFGLTNTPRVTDHVYGPYAGRNIPEEKAIENADSYAWLASEIFWKQECEGNPNYPNNNGPFGEPTEADNGGKA